MRPFKLESIRQIRKMTRHITDAAIAESLKDFSPVSQGDVVLGIVPDDVKKIFLAASQYSKLGKVAEMQSSMLGPCTRRDMLQAKQRQCEQLAKVARETAWAEVILEFSKYKDHVHYHLKENWTLVAVPEDHECGHEHPDRNPLTDVIETITNGQALPNGAGYVKPTGDGGYMVAIDATALQEEAARRRQELEDERLKNSKPN